MQTVRWILSELVMKNQPLRAAEWCEGSGKLSRERLISQA